MPRRIVPMSEDSTISSDEIVETTEPESQFFFGSGIWIWVIIIVAIFFIFGGSHY